RCRRRWPPASRPPPGQSAGWWSTWSSTRRPRPTRRAPRAGARQGRGPARRRREPHGGAPGGGGRSTAQEFRHPERQIERLARIEAGVTSRGVAGTEIAFDDLLCAAEAFGDVVAGELHVHTTGPRPLFAVHREEGAQLGEDDIKTPRLSPTFAGERVAVHRIADPDHGMALGFDCPQDRRQQLADPLRSETGDEGQATRQATGVQPFAQSQGLLGGTGRADLAADGVVYAREELDVGPVELARAVADPEQVGRAVV